MFITNKSFYILARHDTHETLMLSEYYPIYCQLVLKPSKILKFLQSTKYLNAYAETLAVRSDL